MPTLMTQLRQAILHWAQSNPDIRSVIEVGAGVRSDHPADAWSDLDLELYITDVSRYASHNAWFEAFATVWVYLPLHVEGGFPSRLVIFEGGNKVDFVLYSVEELKRRAQWQALPEIYRRGYRIALDKDHVAAGIPASPFAPSKPEPPLASTFLFTVQEFWFEAFHVAKYLRRGDLWSVKFRDRATKDGLLQMMEWHAQVVRGIEDTWHSGRFMKEWTEAETWTALHEAFGGFDSQDSWQALLVTMDTFRRLAMETAAGLGYAYPTDVDTNMSEFIESLRRQGES